MNLLTDFWGLLFPEVCKICGNTLFTNEEFVCTKCFLHLPETHFNSAIDNPVTRIFWGRVPLKTGTARYFYRKDGAAQKLIHLLKYQGHKDIGLFLGNQLGASISDSSEFNSVDVIIPIPLHHKKFRRRGFNQSELIAEGIREITNIEIDTKAVFRAASSETQTKRSAYKRWENVSGIFKLADDNNLRNKHVLVVDDVITTGSTMEACLNALMPIEGISLSVAAIAYSHN